jgi:hypothetical protein
MRGENDYVGSFFASRAHDFFGGIAELQQRT